MVLDMQNVLEQLTAVLEARKQSWARQKKILCRQPACQGFDQILKKVAEESGETLLAAKDVQHGADKSKLIYETAGFVVSHAGDVVAYGFIGTGCVERIGTAF